MWKWIFCGLFRGHQWKHQRGTNFMQECQRCGCTQLDVKAVWND